MTGSTKKTVESGIEQGSRRHLACRTCLRTTNHIVLSAIRESWQTQDNFGYEQFELVQCQGCETVGFRVESWMDDDIEPAGDGTWHHTPTESLYPKAMLDRQPFGDRHLLPPLLETLYGQVYTALREELDVLAVIGIRALIERTCIEVGAEADGLEKKLATLVAMGKLVEDDVEAFKPIRQIGNLAAHEVIAPPRPDILKCLGVVENMMERVFLVPARSEHLAKVVVQRQRVREAGEAS